MISSLSFSNPSLSSRSQDSVQIDSEGIVSANSPYSFIQVDVSHFANITIKDEWGEVNFNAFIEELYRRFEEANFNDHKQTLEEDHKEGKDSIKEYAPTKCIEVGSSAAYDAYSPYQKEINGSLPKSLQDKCKDIDLNPSFDRDLRFKVNKNVVGRAEEFFLATLKATCANFNQALFKWREKFYDLKDNVYILSIKDKNNNQYDFYIYETSPREYFASRDAAQLDLTPYVTQKQKANLIVHDFHPLQPYTDRIEKKLRIPNPESVNHQGFLLYLYYIGIKGYKCVQANAEDILKKTILEYLKNPKNHKLNDLISKFVANHPADNAFTFIFSVNNRLGFQIPSPFKEYSTSQLRVCAQIRNPVERLITHEGKTLLMGAPTVEDVKSFDWKCPLLNGNPILDAILEFEMREPLNPAAKAMFDSYVESLNEELRSSALKRRLIKFGSTERRSAVVMQTLSSTKMRMAPDLLAIVATYSDENHWDKLINSLSTNEWIQSNPEKAKQIFEWARKTNHKEVYYPFLKGLILYWQPSEIEKFVQEAWKAYPDVLQILSLKEELGKKSLSLCTFLSPLEEEIAPKLERSVDFFDILGYPKTETGKLSLFRLYAKEDRLKAIKYAVEAKVSDKLYLEILPLIRQSDSGLDPSLLNGIVQSCKTSHYELLVQNLPYSWISALPEKAEEVFNVLTTQKKTALIYPFLRELLAQCPFTDPSRAVICAFRAHPDINEILKLAPTAELPTIFREIESEIVPLLTGRNSVSFRAVLGDPATIAGKTALYSILSKENPSEAIRYAAQCHLPANVVDQFLERLGTGSEQDKQHLSAYLSSLSELDRVNYWRSWLKKTTAPLQSPLFPWLIDELKKQFHQGLFIDLVDAALPHSVSVIATLECPWIEPLPAISARVLEILAKTKGDSYIGFLKRLIVEDKAASIPQYCKRLWDLNQDLQALFGISPLLDKRGLKLSCLFPHMERDLAKPFSKTLHETKKNFNDETLTRLVEMAHPSHLENLTDVVIANPHWIRNHPNQAHQLLIHLVTLGKSGLILKLMPVLFSNGDANNIQDCALKAWPLIRNYKAFLEHKETLKSRGVSLSTVFRPLEAEVLNNLAENQATLAQARDFFERPETPAGKRSYLALLMRGSENEAIAFAKETRLEVDLLEMSKGALPLRALEGKTDWPADEVNRLWNIAENTLNLDLIQILLPHSRDGFCRVLEKISAHRENINRADVLYPEILSENVRVALPYILAQTQMNAATSEQFSRFLEEGSLDERIALLKWAKSVGVNIEAYVAKDSKYYTSAYQNQAKHPQHFNALYEVVGRKPFEELWESLTSQQRLDLAKTSPQIFSRIELKNLLDSLADSIFATFEVQEIEALVISPTKKAHYLSCFRSKFLFETLYPSFFDEFVKPETNTISREEYKEIFNYILKYKSGHILTLMSYHESLIGILDDNDKAFIDESLRHLRLMETVEEEKLYHYAVKRNYLPYALLLHLSSLNNFTWFKRGLYFLISHIDNYADHGRTLAMTVLKGAVRFEEEMFKEKPDEVKAVITMFSALMSPHDVLECLKNGTNKIFHEICFYHINQILRDWITEPKKRVKSQEEAIGKVLANKLESYSAETCSFLASEPFKTNIQSFPDIINAYRIAQVMASLRQAKNSASAKEKISACEGFIISTAVYGNKNPDSMLPILDLYISIIMDIIDLEGDIAKIKFLTYAIFFIFVNPDNISNLTVASVIPEITTLKKNKNLTHTVVYVTKLLDAILSKKYKKQVYLTYALEASNNFLLWLLGGSKDFSKTVLPLLKKRIYFIPPTPEFHFSEFIICNQALLKAADSWLPTIEKTEFTLAANIKNPDNSQAAKLLPERIEGFNRYAVQFLNHNSTRAAQHVLNALADLIPHYKKLKDPLNLKTIFLGLMARAAIDPKEPTATGSPYILRLKEVLIDYTKALFELKEKEREKYLPDYLVLFKELIFTFYKVCEGDTAYIGHYTDFLTMIEYEKYINGRYDVYFDICIGILPQFVKVLDEVSRDALDPMSVLIICQRDVPDKYKFNQTKTLDKWFDILCKAGKRDYVAYMINEFQAIEDICSDEMKKTYLGSDLKQIAPG